MEHVELQRVEEYCGCVQLHQPNAVSRRRNRDTKEMSTRIFRHSSLKMESFTGPSITYTNPQNVLMYLTV